MDDKILNTAMQLATDAAERAPNYKPETYGAVLLVELMRLSVVPANPGRQLPPAEPNRVPRSQKPYSAAELFAAKGWSTEIDKVVLSGFFLERHGGSESYTIEEVKNCLIAAKVPLPKNVNLAILQAVQKGLMMEIPSKSGPRKAWSLTQTGERYVEDLTATMKDSRM
jgi:hypothetical protein